MTRTMFDSVNPLAIPTTAEMVAGYIDGADAAIHEAWTANWDRFSNAVKVRIAVLATTNDGHVLDVESGNALPGEAPSWVLMRRAAGMDPTVYMSLSAWPTVRQAFRDQNVAEPQYWVAYYPAAPGIPVGCVAHQYADPVTSGGNYDLSVVADVWPGVDTFGPGGGSITDEMTPADSANLAQTASDLSALVYALRGLAPDGKTAATKDNNLLLRIALALETGAAGGASGPKSVSGSFTGTMGG
jgi:hypothetical protein